MQVADEKSPLLVQVYIGTRDGKVVNVPLQVTCCHHTGHCSMEIRRHFYFYHIYNFDALGNEDEPVRGQRGKGQGHSQTKYGHNMGRGR